MKLLDLQEIKMAVNSAFQNLHTLLDRELFIRRQVDLVVEDSSSYDLKKNVRLKHRCEGIVSRSYSLKEVVLFKQCNQLC
jgi:hypothetical protein